jgi:hypothetical protein
MGLRDKLAAYGERFNDEQRAKALENVQARRDWIVTKLATNVSLTGQALDSDISKFTQELFFLDAALKSLADSGPPADD